MRQKQKRRGNKRRHPIDASSIGWRSKVRTKESRYAEAGYLYEVRLPQRTWFPGVTTPRPGEVDPHGEVCEVMQRTTDCRIVGRNLGDTRCSRRYMIRHANTRIYLRTDADLFQLRMVCNEVFRIYRLTPPSPAR